MPGPPPNQLDLTNQVFGRLTAKARSGQKWQCDCACGGVATVATCKLNSGHTRSCGCLKREEARTRLTVHGMSKTDTYRAWHEMNRRCSDPSRDNYDRYGGAGVTVDPEWMAPNGFPAFLAKMGERPSLDHSVDREDRTKPHGPANARWATTAQQMRNRSDNVWLTHDGRTMVLVDWARDRGIKVGTLWARLESGWPTARALTEPVGSYRW